MNNQPAKSVKRPNTIRTGIVILAIVVGQLFVEYRRYAFAIAWHCIHGNYAEVGGHTVHLPKLWWKERAHGHDTSDTQDHDEWLERACPSRLFEKPEINVSKAIPGEIADTDEAELDLTQRVISTMNQDPTKGWSNSLVVLKASKSTLYCQQTHAELRGLELDNGLWCHAVTLPYSLRYNGPLQQEDEAKAIFMSLQ